MAYLIGTDEAGYAPNLGPLVISTTVWHVAEPEGVAQHDLYKPLRSVVCKGASQKINPRRVAWADSKLLYKPPGGLERLERGVLSALGLLGTCPTNWHEIWNQLDVDAVLHLKLLPWHVDYEAALPLAADPADLAALCPRLKKVCERAGITLVGVRSTAVFPERFNQWTDDCGNKGEALSQLTLRLVGESLKLCPGEPVTIVCDKHGGRNRYGRLLQQQFPEPLVEVHRESMAESVYRWGPEDRRIEIRFRTGGESFLPAAVASMVSKYLRELAMRAFNHFWSCRIPELRPTAGYPLDARRFKQAIQATQTELGIDDRILWRSR